MQEKVWNFFVLFSTSLFFLSRSRSELDEASCPAVSARGAGGSGSGSGGDVARGTVAEGDSIGGGGGCSQSGVSGVRSGLMAEGDSSAFGPLVQIEESAGGGDDGRAGGDGDARRQQVRLAAWMVDVYCFVLVAMGRAYDSTPK